MTTSSSPRRARPARASRTASQEPLRTNEIRVSTFPRISVTRRPSPRAANWAARRGEPVPTTDPAGSSPRVRPSRATRASRASSRTGIAATRRPGSGATGRSLSEWTATSISPASRALRRAVTKTPVPPMLDSDAVEVSPKVVISTISTVCPSSRRQSATHPDWVVARVLRRVPSRMLMAFTPRPPSQGGPTRRQRRGGRGRRALAGRGRSRHPARQLQGSGRGRSACARAS